MRQNTYFYADMENFGTILLIVNPISGNLNKENLVEKLKSQLNKKTVLKIYRTQGKDDQNNIFQEIETNSPDRILVIGGDGTVKLVAESMNEKNIPIGILPAGSANGLVNDLGISLDFDQAISTALSDRTTDIDAIRINGQLCLHIADFGLNAELIKKYEQGSIRGKFGYALNSISTLYNSEMPYEFETSIHGKTKKHTAIMLAFANSRKFGTGAVVNPKGKIDDGKFEILIFKKFDLLEMFKTLRGELKMSPDFVEIISTDHAKVTTSIPVDFQIDGEYCGPPQKVEAEILHKKLRIAID